MTDGACHTYSIWKTETTKVILFVWKFLSFYVITILLCLFCYWRILIVIRRQAKVMAGHNAAAGSSTAPAAGQTQTNQMKSSVIKTMIFVSAFYAISWLPTYIYMLLLNLDSPSVL